MSFPTCVQCRSTEFYLEKYNLQVWSTQRNSNQQWCTIHLVRLPKLMQQVQDKVPCRSTRETPFSLVCSSEVVIPIKSRLATTLSKNPCKEQNNLELAFELDHLNEGRE